MSAALAESDALAIPDVPDDFELVHGKLVECRPMSFYAGLVVNAINAHMVRNEACRDLGRSLIEQYFWFPTASDPKRIRRPDLAFVTFETWPESAPIPPAGKHDRLPARSGRRSHQPGGQRWRGSGQAPRLS